MRKIAAGAAALFILGASALATAGSAEARPWRRYHGGGWRGPAAVGVVGALALGAMAAGAYGAPGPVYGECRIGRAPVYNRWGDQVGWRRVRYCD